MSFKKQVRDFTATNRTVMAVQETQGAKDDVIAAYVAGAKSVAQLAIALGDVLQATAPAMTPQQEFQCRAIFEQIKEVVDHE
jgi:predicted lysophospholipase L1 biosynthesis ABC-type transport system permease subunit